MGVRFGSTGFTNNPPGRWPTFLRLRALEQAASPKNSRTPGTPRRHMEETPASPLTFSTLWVRLLGDRRP